MYGVPVFRFDSIVLSLSFNLSSPYKWLSSASIESTVHVLNTLHTSYITIIDCAVRAKKARGMKGHEKGLFWAERRKLAAELAECLLVFWLLVFGKALLLEIKWIRMW